MNTGHWFRPVVLALSVAALAACGGGEEGTAEDTAAAGGQTAQASGADSAAGMHGMEGMQGMGGMQGGMMEQMRSHMQMMQGASGDSLSSMMSSHRQMTANMLAQYTREMREMNMTPDPAEQALADSVRQDLRTLPEMSGAELQAAMPGHHARVMRLMESHQKMMGNMKM